MTITLQAEAPPMRQDESGALRIGGTRVLVELVIRAFQDGATPEAIVQRYSTLELSDVYATIAYYLRHTNEMDAYLSEREQYSNTVRQKVESRQGTQAGIRERLLARRQGGMD